MNKNLNGYKCTEMNYLILSTGEYSDYHATWYAGEKRISDKEFQEVGIRFGDEIVDWFYGLHEKTVEGKYGQQVFRVKEDGEEINQYMLTDIWEEKMVGWLKDNGYSMIEASGEINTGYSDIPTSKNKDE